MTCVNHCGIRCNVYIRTSEKLPGDIEETCRTTAIEAAADSVEDGWLPERLARWPMRQLLIGSISDIEQSSDVTWRPPSVDWPDDAGIERSCARVTRMHLRGGGRYAVEGECCSVVRELPPAMIHACSSQPMRTLPLLHSSFRCVSVGSRPSDNYFRSVCLSVCLFLQSFSQPSSIRFGSN